MKYDDVVVGCKDIWRLQHTDTSISPVAHHPYTSISVSPRFVKVDRRKTDISSSLPERFDAVISYRAYKRIDVSHLMMVAPTMSTDTAVWLLYQKVLAEGTTEAERIVTPPNAAGLPARRGRSIQTYLLWACRLAVSCQGAI
jgi:hypothetical protein